MRVMRPRHEEFTMARRVTRSKLCEAVALTLSIALAGGCGSSPAKSEGNIGGAAATTARPDGSSSSSSHAQVLGTNFGNQAEAPARARLRVVQLEIYRLIIPHGAISRSEEFWKHIDEHEVDVGTYDLLRKNGWRVGTAPSGEWPYFRDIIDAYPASSRPYGLAADQAGGGSHMELMMKQGVPDQNLFYFDDANALYGRTYERGDNLLNISLQQAPRKAGEARVTVCPTIRSLRRRFEVNTRGDEREIRYVHPERLFDLNLQADIPIDHFLVIAPSPEVRWKTSLGAAFLIEDGPAERLEHVLLLVPRVGELEETVKPAVPPAPAAE